MQQDIRGVSRRLYLVIALALIGLGLSASLSLHYYDLRSGTAEFRSFCNMNDTMNCDAVSASRFAELVSGFPLSSFSGGWYLAMAILALLALGASWRRTASRALFGMSVVGVAFSVVYFIIMMSVLKKYCLQCLMIDGVNLALLGITATLRGAGGKATKENQGQWPRVLATVAGSVLLFVLFFKSYDQSQLEGITHDELADSVLNASVVNVSVPEGSPILGSPNAPVTIVEFSDFQCPFCRNGAKMLHTLLERFPGKVRVVYRGYPLDRACNRFMQHGGHPAACEASKAAICAGQQGKFEEVYEAIFERQSELKPGVPTKIALESGLDEAKLKGCMDAPETGIALKQAIEEANALGVKSTPTFFVNGRKVEGAYPVPVWTKVIERLLAGQATASN